MQCALKDKRLSGNQALRQEERSVVESSSLRKTLPPVRKFRGCQQQHLRWQLGRSMKRELVSDSQNLDHIWFDRTKPNTQIASKGKLEASAELEKRCQIIFRRDTIKKAVSKLPSGNALQWSSLGGDKGLAVVRSGSERNICSLPGRWKWKQTPLATSVTRNHLEPPNCKTYWQIPGNPMQTCSVENLHHQSAAASSTQPASPPHCLDTARSTMFSFYGFEYQPQEASQANVSIVSGEALQAQAIGEA